MGALARGSSKKAMKFLLLLALCGSVANAGIFSSSSCSGKTVPSGACALLYDDEDCGGWEYEVPSGYSELGFTKRNDAESVLVKQGCTFTGYDHADAGNFRARGDSVEVDARNSRTAVKKNLEDDEELEERITSMTCTCGRPSSSSNVANGEIGRSSGERGRSSGERGRSFSSSSAANTRTFSSSSCPGKTVPSSACALLYDNEDCKGWEYQVPRGYSELGFTKRNDAESVLVRQGCKFIGYDHDDRDDISGRGDSVEVNAWFSRTDLLKNFEGRGDLEERISSMACS